MPGIEPTSSQATVDMSTLPAMKWPKPATYRSAAAWKMSVPTTLCARSGKTTSKVSPKKTPLPTDVRPTTKPPKIPMRIAATRSWFVSSHSASTRSLRPDEALGDEPDGAEEQRHPEDLPHDVLHAVPVAVDQVVREPDPDKGGGNRADEHPASEPRPHVAHTAVLDGADGLEHRAVRDVGSDRRRRRHSEEEDEDRGH